ncbi:adenosylcobinamide-phosphate synthase CbiB [Sulfitobacter aestuarii]|uniref:Cobalamin biosynthesis protein CobD n=1 Tax=Sulfitobacter aestuarii TaxID=2161676 RepID=A0ABW5TX01_9RHOB
MNTALLLVCALLLDALFGEPDWLWQRLPHPAVLMGRAVAFLDKRLNQGRSRFAKGALSVALLVLAAGLLGALLSLLGPLVEILLAAILLAQRSLVAHVRAVADGLRISLPEGRRAVGMIVSRDTDAMPTPNICRSAIESAAENLGDGVVAPAFWFLIGGLPGIFIYKIVNTADSMIGYRNTRYEQFGKAAARLDDLLNLIPARLTALLIALPGGVMGDWAAIREDAARHRSPNAGWPEAATARAIDVALSGPRAYDGVMQQFAWVNGSGGRDIGPPDIDRSVTCLWQAWTLMLLATLGLGLVLS